MKVSNKVIRIAAEVEDIKESYRSNQLYSGLTNINAVGWLVAGFGFFFVGITILCILCFCMGVLNAFTILLGRRKKEDAK